MKVSELIKTLQTFDPESNVVFDTGSGFVSIVFTCEKPGYKLTGPDYAEFTEFDMSNYLSEKENIEVTVLAILEPSLEEFDL